MRTEPLGLPMFPRPSSKYWSADSVVTVSYSRYQRIIIYLFHQALTTFFFGLSASFSGKILHCAASRFKIMLNWMREMGGRRKRFKKFIVSTFEKLSLGDPAFSVISIALPKIWKRIQILNFHTSPLSFLHPRSFLFSFLFYSHRTSSLSDQWTVGSIALVIPYSQSRLIQPRLIQTSAEL